MIQRIFITCIALLITITIQYSQSIVVSDSQLIKGFSKDRLERLDARMHQFVDTGQLSGVQTLIYRSGKIVHFDTYGNADIL